jgi:hypothetical protein
MKHKYNNYEVKSYIKLNNHKMKLALALGWPLLSNLSWTQVWPGGWCFHGKGTRIRPNANQYSMNFELDPEELNPIATIKQALNKVKSNPEKLAKKIRWSCLEHGWEVIKPIGVMTGGCPKCFSYSCAPVE